MESGSGEVRQAVREAAARLFAERGYAATGILEIAEAAGANKAMLYYYFGSKGQLYDALVAEGLDRVEAAVEMLAQGELPVEARLRAFVTSYLSFILEQPALSRIVYREGMGSGERAQEVVRTRLSRSIRRIAAALQQTQARGELGPIDTSLAAYSIFGMANMFVSSHFLTGRRLEVAALANHIVALFLHGAGQDRS